MKAYHIWGQITIEPYRIGGYPPVLPAICEGEILSKKRLFSFGLRPNENNLFFRIMGMIIEGETMGSFVWQGPDRVFEVEQHITVAFHDDRVVTEENLIEIRLFFELVQNGN